MSATDPLMAAAVAETSNFDDDVKLSVSLVGLLTSLHKSIAAGFAETNTRLDSKADKVDLTRIETRLEEHAKQIGELQSHKDREQTASNALQRRDDRARDWRRWVVEAAISAVACGGIIAGVLH